MILETRRLTLRPLEAADARDIYALMSDRDVMAYWDVAEVTDPALVQALTDAQVARARKGEAFYWSMRRREDGAFVGCCDLSELDRWHHRAEIGFMIGRTWWGDGYAHEAVQAVVAHAAQALRLQRLSARVHAGNIRSVCLLERIGFRQEGLLRGYVQRDGERRDCMLFGLLL